LLDVEADGEIQRAVASAVTLSGFETRSARLESMRNAFAAGLSVINAETWAAFGHLVDTGKLGADIDARLRAAADTKAADLEAAELVRAAITAEVDRELEHADVIILPTMPSLPITIEAARRGTSVIGMSSLIRPFNLSGHPALTVPVPIEGTLLKAGLQIVGRKGEDETVCAVAAHVEATLASNT
jgi:amidase